MFEVRIHGRFVRSQIEGARTVAETVARCGLCAAECPSGAITMLRERS